MITQKFRPRYSSVLFALLHPFFIALAAFIQSSLVNLTIHTFSCAMLSASGRTFLELIGPVRVPMALRMFNDVTSDVSGPLYLPMVALIKLRSMRARAR